MLRVVNFLILLVLLCGCAELHKYLLGDLSSYQIDSSIAKYRATAPKINLGDSKEQVLPILLPTQQGLPNSAVKLPESFEKDGNVVEIYYFRSMRQPDNLTTDDEFTPYVFTNGKLTSIGWTSLGGPRTHGQVIQPAPKINQTTEINQTIERADERIRHFEIF